MLKDTSTRGLTLKSGTQIGQAQRFEILALRKELLDIDNEHL